MTARGGRKCGEVAASAQPSLAGGTAARVPARIVQAKRQKRAYDHADYLGTVSRQTNSSQATTGTRAYDAFGMLVSSTGTPQGPFGFVGGYGYQEDADSGLKLLGHRYYDPSTGRFLTRDPAKDGRNWYAYCENGPTIGVDRNGLTDWEDTIFAGALVNKSKKPVTLVFDRGSGRNRRTYTLVVPPGYETTPHVDADWVHRDDGKWEHIRGGFQLRVWNGGKRRQFIQPIPAETEIGSWPGGWDTSNPGGKPPMPYPDPYNPKYPLLVPDPTRRH